MHLTRTVIASAAKQNPSYLHRHCERSEAESLLLTPSLRAQRSRIPLTYTVIASAAKQSSSHPPMHLTRTVIASAAKQSFLTSTNAPYPHRHCERSEATRLRSFLVTGNPSLFHATIPPSRLYTLRKPFWHSFSATFLLL